MFAKKADATSCWCLCAIENGRLHRASPFGAGPIEGEFDGELSKIYLRWEYHRLRSVGRRDDGRNSVAGSSNAASIRSCCLPSSAIRRWASNDRMGGERLRDDLRGQDSTLWRLCVA